MKQGTSVFVRLKKRVWSHSFQQSDFVIFFSSIKQTRSKSMCAKYMINDLLLIIIAKKKRGADQLHWRIQRGGRGLQSPFEKFLDPRLNCVY